MTRSMVCTTILLCLIFGGCSLGDQRAGLDPSDQVNALALDGPLFSLSEGMSPVPWVLNLTQAGAILRNGTSVLVNYNESLAIAFDTAGNVLFLTGRRGGGPGEFAGGVGTLLPVGSGFGAWDLRSRRFSFFDSIGNFTHAASLADLRLAQPIAWMHEHGLVVTEYMFEAEQPRQYLVADTTDDSRLEINGPPAPPDYSIRYADERGQVTMIAAGHECTPSLFATVIADALYVAHSGTGTIYRYTLDNTWEIVYQETRRQIVTDHVLQLVQTRYSMAPLDSVLPYLRTIGSAGDPLPTWSAILSDEALALLLLLETRCGSDLQDASTLTVVSTRGEFRGRVRIPAAAMVLAARDGHILIARRDSLGVEYAELYALPVDILRSGK